MNRLALQTRSRPRALLLLALLLHLLGAAFAAPLHARLSEPGAATPLAGVFEEDGSAHDELGCAVCLALHSPALPAIGEVGGEPASAAALPAALVQRRPSASTPSLLRARAPPLP